MRKIARSPMGQSSMEYVIAMAGLVIILISLYEVSSSMNQQSLLVESQLEGERVAAQLGRSIDAAGVAGPGTSVNISLYTFPQKELMISGGEIIARGVDNKTAAFIRHLDYVTTPVNLVANQSVQIIHNETGLYVRALG